METKPIASSEYETKGDNYFEWVRPEMVPFVPPSCRRLLDVGCGAGAFGESLKQTRKIEIWGVELVKSAAEKASAKLDRVMNAPFDSEIGLPAESFDCIVFNDVLEHLLAPEKALRYAKTLLSPGGVVVASIPNVRYLGIVWQLLFDGKWEYVEAGILDKTHVHFFTKSSIETLFQSEGYSVENICGINPYGSPPWVATRRMLIGTYKLANGLFFGKFTDMKFAQFVTVAKASQESKGVS